MPFERSLAAEDLELAGRIAEHALMLSQNWLDYEGGGVGRAVCDGEPRWGLAGGRSER